MRASENPNGAEFLGWLVIWVTIVVTGVVLMMMLFFIASNWDTFWCWTNQTPPRHLADCV